VPEKAPFFLPSLENAKPAAVPSEKLGDGLAERSRIMRVGNLNSEGAFTSALRAGRKNSNCKHFPIYDINIYS
jgi:U3 small nucleolar RNA-associated protein 21